MATTGGLSPAPVDPNAGRLMQIKVLYTFDDAKTNCLARCPHPVPVRTAMLDAKTEVGIIELRTCIQAIVAASPELVAKLGQDFTIYAYDYSEYETPLVGQGMLSWALAASSSTPTAPADQSQTPVTGRVTRGGLNLFSSYGGSETLEVKLKLVPVPTTLQSEYLESMQKYRDASNFSTQGGSPAAWNDFVRSNPNFPAPSPSGVAPAQQPLNPIMSQPNPPQQPQGQCGIIQPTPIAPQRVHDNAPSSRPASRPSTPKRKRKTQSRQSSRASSTRDRPPLKHSSSTSQMDNVIFEDGRKRALVEQTNWRGPSALSATNDSLRVTASTAASIRGHNVPGGNPSTAHVTALEPSARPPTPRPSRTGPSRQLRRTDTGVANDAMTHRPRHSSFLAMNTVTDNEGSAATSPESQDESIATSPVDMPSSPPVMPQMLDMPSSPPLPRSATFHDSGFDSSFFDDFMNSIDKQGNTSVHPEGDDDVQELPPPRTRDLEPSNLESEISIFDEPPRNLDFPTPSGMPTGLPPQEPHLPEHQRSNPKKRPSESAVESRPKLPKLAPAPRPEDEEQVQQEEMNPIVSANVNNYLLAQQEAAQPRPSTARRESTGSFGGQAMELILSTEGEDSNNSKAPKPKSGIKRKIAIKGRLDADLAAGKMPPFCKNCGEIETPTWRKCFIRTVQGPFPEAEELEELEKDDAFLGLETVDTDEDGKVTSHRIRRRNIAKGDCGWEERKLCNSCGMYIFKFKKMRPPEKWVKQPSKGAPRKRPSRSKKVMAERELKSEPNDTASLFDNEGDSPYDNELPASDVEPHREGFADFDRDERNQRATTDPRPDTSEEQDTAPASTLDEVAAMAALQKAINESPPKFPGSQSAPFDLDEQSKSPPTRRLLFPSPRKDGQMKTLDGSPGETGVNPSVTISSADSPSHRRSNSEKENAGPRAERASTPNTFGLDGATDVFKTPQRKTYSATGLTPDSKSPGSSLRRSQRTSPSKYRTPAVTPFTAQMNQMLTSDPVGSPTRFSDPAFDLFDDSAFGGNGNAFDFVGDFNNEGYVADMPIPGSDADYFPVFDDVDMGLETWNGGPLFEGELDALLKEAGDNGCETYFAANGIEETATPAEKGAGQTPLEEKATHGA